MAKVHAMIDLETLGTRPNTQVLSIGGVKFHPNNKDKPFDEFYFKVDIDAQEASGRTVDESTLEWWGKQEESVILEAFSEEGRVHPVEMLEALKKWCVGVDTFWAQGTSFDMVILEDMCRMYDVPIPWPFWKVKDSRTLFGLMAKDPRKAYTFEAHNALEDCKIQAQCVQDTVLTLGVTI